jgi:hypothetical protein
VPGPNDDCAAIGGMNFGRENRREKKGKVVLVLN